VIQNEIKQDARPDPIPMKKTLVHVLGIVYVHTKTSDGGDLYLTKFAEPYQEHLSIENWYEKSWFNEHKVRLEGTSAVYRVPTKAVHGESIDLVVKNSRVGEDVPLDTHTLQEYCDAEFNSPWEEFALNDELREGRYGPKDVHVDIQHPMAIYVPPEKMQLWQSGRSRSKINRIRAKHPGIDLDILKQYKLIYLWIHGKSITELFCHIPADDNERNHHVQTMNDRVFEDMKKKGFLVADMKPEHIIISQDDIVHIEQLGWTENPGSLKEQVDMLYHLINRGNYSVVDYELLLRTPEHEDEVKYSRRHSYLDDQRDRFRPTPLPDHLSYAEIFGVPYIYGHAESTGGHLWVVGKNARLFDYFLPERWRKTPVLQMSDMKEIFYTITKDNIHLVWKTSLVGELPAGEDEEYTNTVYIRAIYMTGSIKLEASIDFRKYETHQEFLDSEGNPILQESHNYITIRGFYNGPDHWVAEHEGPLFTPIDLSKVPSKGILDESTCQELLNSVKKKLDNIGYDGSLLKTNDLLLAMGNSGSLMKNDSGEPEAIICNFDRIWKVPNITV
jgi:hypothetical protein